MSRVNHQRGTKDNRFWLGTRHGPRYYLFSNSRTTMDGKMIVASSTATKESSRGIQQDRAGAKKFVHSRARFHDRLACQKIVREGLKED